MSRLYLRSPLPPFHVASGTALTNTVTATDISPAPQIVPAAAVYLEAGMEFEVNAYGNLSSAASAPGTLTLGIYWGGVAGVALATAGAVTPVVSLASAPWIFYWRGRIRTVGATGQMVGQGFLNLGASLTTFTQYAAPITAAGRTVTIDTTAAGNKALTLGATWSTASASNSITCDDLTIDIAN